jgi:hypothetical protein
MFTTTKALSCHCSLQPKAFNSPGMPKESGGIDQGHTATTLIFSLTVGREKE